MHVGLISDGCGETQRVLMLQEQQACWKDCACVRRIRSCRSLPVNSESVWKLQQLERISALPKAQQHFVMQMLDTLLQQQG